MTREIKFRAWQQEIMCTVVAIEWEDGIPKRACLEPLDEHLYEHTDWLRPAGSTGGPIFLQYTGYHDIDRAEVYDGDIVKAGGFLAYIFWDESHARWDSKWIGRKGPEHYVITRAKVIGNIYENPELMK